MRLHHLRVTAFGPFADTVEIDFDSLSAAGLFLLTGPTGAGKTSVLDAVSFALYGDVPGERSSAKRLRSDHAAAGVAPEVALELTLVGRRFRFLRSPAWERPKKRGVGTTRQQAHVVVTELVHGDWETLTTRLDEAGDLVTALVGMNLDQFCQVAMLPQGRFQTFLRAPSQDRQALLQQLFRTGRFARVESWLRDRRLALHRDSKECHDEVAGLVNRLSEAATHPCPEEWDLRTLDAPAGDGSLHAWAQSGLDSLVTDVEETGQALRELTTLQERAGAELQDARDLAERQARFHHAERQWAELARQEEVHGARLDELSAARRAAAVLPLHRVCEATRRDTVAQTERVSTLRRRLAGLGTEDPGQDLTAVLAEVGRERRALAAGQEAERNLRSSRDRLAQLTSDLERASAVRRSRLDDLAGLPGRRVAVEERLRDAHAARDRVPELQGREATLRHRRAAHREAAALEVELRAAEDTRRAYQDEAQALAQVWLDLREARLAGMAAEIAGGLTVGCHCPVCGSSDHPSPASPRPGAPDADSERAAQRSADDARAVLVAHDDRLQQLRSRLDVARGTAGEEPAERLAAALEDTAEALRTAGELASEVPALEAALASLAAQERQAHEEMLAAEREAARLEASVADLGREMHRMEDAVSEALAGTPHPTVADRCQHLDRVEEALQAAVAAQETLVALEEQLRRHEDELALALREHGFPDVAAATLADRPAAQQRMLESAVKEHEEQRARLGAVLEDDELVRAAAATPPDVAVLQQRHARLQAECEETRTRADQARRARDRTESLARELAEALHRWEPVRHEHSVVSALAALAEGKSADNRLQMRLSAYVLAYRLTQVVHAANARLSTMSDQRYTLQHSGQRGAGESRGGLSLAVVDEWTGTARDPATLSGGETFIVSLALALGLADVITQEAGGAELDTLFVDEGFGSLDAESLDHVLDTLDSLRDGGRVVGVVSHVTEMSERIPTQLKVLKARRGSTVAVAAGA